jgi:hypothetical protein
MSWERMIASFLSLLLSFFRARRLGHDMTLPICEDLCLSGILFIMTAFLFPAEKKQARAEGKQCHAKTVMSRKAYEAWQSG